MVGKQNYSSVLKSQKGSAILLVLLATTILMILGTVALKVSEQTRDSADLAEKKIQAQYIAESALTVNRYNIYSEMQRYIQEKAAYQADPTKNSPPKPINIQTGTKSLYNGTYDLTVTMTNSDTNELTAVAHGYVKGQDGLDVKKTITVKFVPDNSSGDNTGGRDTGGGNNSGDNGGGSNGGNTGANNLSQVFKYGIFSDDSLILLSDVEVNSFPAENQGNIGTNGNLILYDRVKVNGDAYYNGVISLNILSKITGDRKKLPQKLSFPVIDEQTWKSAAGSAPNGQTVYGDVVYSGSKTINLTQRRITGSLIIDHNATIIASGIIWVDGHISIDHNAKVYGTATFVSKDGIYISHNADIDNNFTSNIAFISLKRSFLIDSAITLSNQVDFRGVLYAPYGLITLASKCNVNGSVVGEQVLGVSDCTITYNTDLPNNFMPLPGDDMSIKYPDAGTATATNTAATNTSSSSGQIDNVFTYAIFSDSKLSMTNNSKTDSYTDTNHGNVATNDTIDMSVKAVINGDAYYYKSAPTLNNGSKITGQKIPLPNKITMPAVDVNGWKNSIITDAGGNTVNASYLSFWHTQQTLSNCVVNGNVSPWESTLTLSNCVIKGNLSVGASTLNISGKVWVEGSVDFNNSTVVKGTGTIISEKNISLTNSVDAYQNNSTNLGLISLANNGVDMSVSAKLHGVIYAPNGSVVLSNSSKVYGAVVGKQVSLNTDAQVIYDQNLSCVNIPLPGTTNSDDNGNGNDNGNGGNSGGGNTGGDNSNDGTFTPGAILPSFKIIEWKES